MSTVVAIHRDQYYTNGTQLYRVIRVHKDGTVTVENCSTLFSARFKLDDVLRWDEVKLNVSIPTS